MNKKVVFLPYDFDTAIGINNEGSLAFSYNLEDTDTISGGADVFNGQQSVLWKNLRDAFGDSIKAMYQTLRSTGALSYAKTEQFFEAHQNKWPEAVFNEDAWFKYLQPLVESGDASYLSMLLGSKAEQRKWWLYNRFRYIDSKYNAGDALTDVITLRGYAKANVVITPYADIYAAVKYGSALVQTRAARNQSYTLVCPLDSVNDTEIYIYSASQLASVGDLSGFKVGYANFSMATKLQSLKLGDSDQEYENGNLTELYLGNNKLLGTIDCRNCTALGTGNIMQAVDISGCSNIEYVYFDGTKITGLTLPNGGILKVLHVPSTMTNLTIRNQTAITDFTMPAYTNLTTVRIENVSSAVPTADILSSLAANSRVRLIGFSWDVETYAAAAALYDKLDTMRGLDEHGGNMDHAQVSGTIHVDSLTGAQLASLQERYPDITVTYDHITSYLYYKSYDGSTLIYTETILDGGDGTYSGTPSRSSTAQYDFTFVGWNTTQDAQTANANATKAVTADRTIYAAYSRTTRTYTVTFAKQSADGGGTLQTVNNIPYGGNASYTGSTPTTTKGSATDYPFEGWSPAPTNIQGNTTCYAVFGAPLEVAEITDSWADIITAIEAGTATYKVGNYKDLDLGAQGTIRMQIAGKGVDPLADNTGNAATSWVAIPLLATTKRMNPDIVSNYKFESGESFKRQSTSTSNTGYNQWNSQNAYTANNTAKITITVTAVADGTLRLKYVTGSQSYNAVSLKIDGTEIVSSYSTSAKDYDLTITNGTTYVIVYEAKKLNNTDTTNTYIKLCNTSNSGKNSDVSALVTQDSVSIDNCTVRVFDYYSSGTGAVGGWDNTEMRAYLKNTIKPLIPEAVRSHIKSVKKYTRTIDTSGATVNNVETTEDVWIPSAREIFGGTSYETTGPQYTVVYSDANSRIKYNVTGGSAAWWWLRSAYNSSYFYYVNNFGSYYTYGASSYIGVALGFCL